MKKVLLFIAGQRPGDLVTLAFLVFLGVLTLSFFSHIPRAPLLLALYSSLMLIQIVLIRQKTRGRLLQAFYDLGFPVICVFAVFDSLEWLVHYVNPHDIDPLLIRLDYLIFSNHPTVMLETLQHPLLTDLLQISYSTYYFIPIVFGILLLRKNDRDAFNQSLFLLLLCFYLSYLGYILFPALGPRFTIDHLQNRELQGLFVAEPIQNLLNRLEGIKRDAFPSGHTGIALLVLYLAYKFQRTYFWICLPVVATLLFSTVYCRYHYVVDIIAGIVLTLFTIWLGNWFYRWWAEKNRHIYRNQGEG